MENKELGLYIHIPFCKAKCNYCGFVSMPNCDEKMQNDYVDALICEIKLYGKRYKGKYEVGTIFIGGGTPSILKPSLISKILTAVFESFCVKLDAEISIESNPKTLTREKLKPYKAVGINRLSIGAQSLDDSMLKKLGRIHTAEEFIETFNLAREAGFTNINVDLMFAIPDHTTRIWEDTLSKIIKLNPEHISFYSLQIEEGTPLFDMFKNGTIEQIPDDIDRKMYHAAIKQFSEAGYKHYEISNCSKKGFECRHNLKYWSMEEYLGLGLAAHSYIEGNRFANTKNLDEYLKAMSHSTELVNLVNTCQKVSPAITFFNINTEKDNMSEFVFTGLRKIEGINLKDFSSKYKKEFWQIYSEERKKLKYFFDEGFLIEEGDMLRLSEKGLDIANKIMMIFV